MRASLLCLILAGLIVALAVWADSYTEKKTAPVQHSWRPPDPDYCARGPVLDGWSLMICSMSNTYRLNERLAVGVSLTPEGTNAWMRPNPSHTNSFLFIILPDHSVTNVHVPAPNIGPGCGGYDGGVYPFLKPIVRKPGRYTIQWKIDRLESGIVAFDVLAE